PKHGETRDGVIASISEGQILVSVGTKSEGLITGKEYEAIPAEILETLEVGKSIPVFVLTPEDQNGNLILSITRAVDEQSWIDAEELLKSSESFDSTIIGYNKGGLLVPLSTIRGFVPASQVSLSRRLAITGNTPDERYSDMVDEKIEVRVIEVDRERRRLILSERAASSDTRESIKDKVIDGLKEGEVRTGRVTSLADFGAFVNINGADGLVHLSEISWDRVNHPSEVLQVGQEVQVKIISVDQARKRIGISIRQILDDPWADQIASLKVGQLVEAEITRLTNFGAFALLKLDNSEGELEGLIHISEISEHRIEHPKEVLHDGDIVTLRIIKIEEDTHRIGLSMRRVDSPAYADLDWKILSDEIESASLAGEGENIASFMTEETEEVISDTQKDKPAESEEVTTETAKAEPEEKATPSKPKTRKKASPKKSAKAEKNVDSEEVAADTAKVEPEIKSASSKPKTSKKVTPKKTTEAENVSESEEVAADTAKAEPEKRSAPSKPKTSKKAAPKKSAKAEIIAKPEEEEEAVNVTETPASEETAESKDK
ncbi:MAG: S1 RNA-binding domain-containing protein, partial [Chloroflexota bacterium]